MSLWIYAAHKNLYTNYKMISLILTNVILL